MTEKKWICRCEISWDEKDRCPDCDQTFKGERRKALWRLGLTPKKQAKKKGNGKDKSALKKCRGCKGTFDNDWCPHCGLELMIVAITQAALIPTNFEDGSYAP